MSCMKYTEVQRARILQGAAVAVLRGDEAPHGYPLLRAWAIREFEQAGGKAMSPELGEVVLDARAVRDSMAHGMNASKAAAFAAVKDVIERGAVVVQARHGNQDSFYVGAPVRISGIDSIVTVLVHHNPQIRRMYLHSVATKEYLLKAKYSGTDAANTASGHTGMATSGDGLIVTPNIVSGKVSSGTVARELHRLLILA